MTAETQGTTECPPFTSSLRQCAQMLHQIADYLEKHPPTDELFRNVAGAVDPANGPTLYGIVGALATIREVHTSMTLVHPDDELVEVVQLAALTFLPVGGRS